MRFRPRYFLLLLAAAASISSGCQAPPAEIWVPGEGYDETLSAELSSSEVRVGEWLELDAERRTGPWIRVPRPERLPSGNCWWRRPPPLVEHEVGARVRWLVEPEGRFNLPNPENGFRRRVRFEQPGSYTIRAQSAGCPGPFDSPPQIVRVVP